jgi:DNA repair protein RecO (recombination protein O)
MSLVMTPAVVLRTYRYSETSKVVRLATRDLGVQSAIAKGALRAKSRFGAGLELLSEGMAQLYHRDSRELHLPPSMWSSCAASWRATSAGSPPPPRSPS